MTVTAIAEHTHLPKSLALVEDELPKVHPADTKVASRFLQSRLSKQHIQKQHALLARKDAELLLPDVPGGLEAEGELERTWKVGQEDIVKEIGLETSRSQRDIKLDGGPYTLRWTRNGRHLAIAGTSGHVATFDWQKGNVLAELQLRESVRDITFLHDYTMFAVAQKKYVYIYDASGVELHRLSTHVDVNRLEFLPYHFLLVSVGNSGYLKYQDTSTGQMVTELRTKMGACATMCQNLHNAVINLGHQHGSVTLWVPNMPKPAVQLQAHLGPVTGLAVDAKTEGRYLASAGLDSKVKIWDSRNWGKCVKEWQPLESGSGGIVEWSGRGLLAFSRGRRVNVYAPNTLLDGSAKPPALYMSHHLPVQTCSIRFRQFEDVLAVGHAAGFSTIIIPGSGEPNPDSFEADIYETRTGRREREVRSLLDKLQPDMISLDANFIGSVASAPKRPYAAAPVPFSRLARTERLQIQGKSDEPMEQDEEDEEEDTQDTSKPEKERLKMRGKGKSMKRFLRKKRKNVIDPATVAIKAKMAAIKEQQEKRKQAAEGSLQPERKGALSRFHKT
ncbi:WD40 repeat-like protein [Dacryopinax primogenitus]|uniref:U three protein 7 n=1 Tax=Dacryopinax primogenitus (strain DJM 731) TaxID=1858805 RepID=M5G1X5_DACPD|nr:WD40 repeat-like protein [Dacryopinax primogenitus]EJT97757.1 WD40 repeat-like protein [Dacryopinax primogenitus]